MIKKLTFKEWFFQCEFRKDGYDCNQVSFANSAWNFAQAQEQKEVEELKKKVEELESRDINKMFHKSMMEVVELKKKLEDAECLIRYVSSRNCPSDINERVDSYLKEKENE